MALVKPVAAAVAVTALLMTLPARAAMGLSSASAGRPQASDAVAWKIDSVHSAANFSVRHLVVSTVRGQMGPVSGTIWYDGKNVSSIHADAVIDVKRISTGNDARDNDLRGPDFFAVDKNPTLTFKSKRVVPVDAGHFQLVGDLRIRETTREVALDVEGPLVAPSNAREQRLAATITTTINRFDYGLKWNALVETGGAVVGPDVKITIDLEVIRPSAPTPAERRNIHQ
jgi:polyisoprenoid-binding protein YceI